jgi:hypothetical protein
LVAGDSVTADAIWKKLDVPYIIDGTVAIGAAGGANVTVRPGVRFECKNSSVIKTGFGLPGALIANGAPDDSIVFTGHLPDTVWGSADTVKGGLMFGDQTVAATSVTYALIEKATAGVFVGADVTIRNCTIRNNQSYGIGFYNDSIPKARISDNAFGDPKSNPSGDTLTLH